MRLSVVIPTLNAGTTLEATLDAVWEGAGLNAAALVVEIVVSDGGSADGTVALAQRRGCVVVTGEKGRGGQLARGAEAAATDWLLFVHADTRLAPGWGDAARRHMALDPSRAAVFRFALDDPSRAARWLERLVAWRGRRLALPYGDQGLLISRALYRSVGGFAALPLMEDVDINRRLGRKRMSILPVDAITSAVRYRRDGYLARVARNALCLTLYFAGVSPQRIARIYG